MNGEFFALISRMRYIDRWALMRNSEKENVQEHSHMTAVLAHALAVIRRDVLGGECDPDRCASIALFHDAAEILTGDMPTPIKYHNEKMTSSYKEIEHLAAEKLLGFLPEELQGEYDGLLEPDESGIEHRIVKAADKLSAYIKCIEERKAGNREFASAEAQCRARLEALKMPEVEYFLKNFVPAFELTLDELGADDGVR